MKRAHLQANGHTAGNARNLFSEQAFVTPIEPFLTWLAICYAILSLYGTQRCDGLHRSIKIGKSSSKLEQLNAAVFSLLIITLYQHYFRSKLHDVLQAGLEFGAALPFAEIIQELRQPVDGSPAPEPYLRMALHIERIAGKWQHLARKEERWDPAWQLMIQDLLECFGTNGSIAGHKFQSDILSRLHALRPMKDLSSLDRCNLTACWGEASPPAAYAFNSYDRDTPCSLNFLCYNIQGVILEIQELDSAVGSHVRWAATPGGNLALLINPE